MKTQKSTMTDLVTELEVLKIDSPYMKNTILEAKAGEYHDYKNQKYVCGKVAIVGRLESIARTQNTAAKINEVMSLRQRIIGGEFDEKPDEQDKAEMRKDCPPELWPALGL